MKTVTETMKFKVPADCGHPEAGQTKTGIPYEFEQAESVDEAQAIAEEKGWTFLEFVNDALKGNARQNKYANLLATYAPKADVSLDTLRARLIRTFIQAGLSEATATAQVDSTLATNNG